VSGVVALIPARAGSKGVPDKNIRPLGGRPLMEWSIAACKRSKLIDRVIVSTDSTAYAALAIDGGAEAPFLRPAPISDDRSTDYEFVVHALDWLAQHGGEPAFVVHVRPTTPFRDPAVMDRAIRAFQGAADATALRSVHEMAESAYKAFEVGAGGYLRKLGSADTSLDAANNARQAFPATYQGNGYVDVLSTAFIRKSQSIHGTRVLSFVTPAVTEVDTLREFEFLEFELARSPRIAELLFS
jgi:CMP-N,N'-diacetyllegionaminic acid synthase